jgi:hypothetical protein
MGRWDSRHSERKPCVSLCHSLRSQASARRTIRERSSASRAMDLTARNKIPFRRVIKAHTETTLEVRWGRSRSSGSISPSARSHWWYEAVLFWALLASGRSTCARSTAGKRLPPRPSISQLISLPSQITSSGWRFRRATSHRIPGGTSALSCNQLRTTHGA